MRKHFLTYIPSVAARGRGHSDQEIRKPCFPHLLASKNLNEYWDGCGRTTVFGVTICSTLCMP